MAVIENNATQRHQVDSKLPIQDTEPTVGQWPRATAGLLGLAAGGAIGFLFPGKKQNNAIIGAIVGLVVGLGVYQAAKKKIDGWFRPKAELVTDDTFIGPLPNKDDVAPTKPDPIEAMEPLDPPPESLAAAPPPPPPPVADEVTAPPPPPPSPVAISSQGTPPNPEIGGANDSPAGSLPAGAPPM